MYPDRENEYKITIHSSRFFNFCCSIFSLAYCDINDLKNTLGLTINTPWIHNNCDIIFNPKSIFKMSDNINAENIEASHDQLPLK